jgi:hypothetical protein
MPVHYNILDGSLLVNGAPLSRLPRSYELHENYRRLLGEVSQPLCHVKGNSKRIAVLVKNFSPKLNVLSEGTIASSLRVELMSERDPGL